MSTFCTPGWGTWELGQGKRGQATSSMPANRELGLHRHLLESLSGVSVFPRLCSGPTPCSLEPANCFLVSLAPSWVEGGQASGDGTGTGLPVKTEVELRGWRKIWPLGGGTGLVSRSDGLTRAAAGLGWVQGLRAGSCCPQEASKCLRILVALLVTGPGLPTLSSCSCCWERRRTCS